MSWIISQAVSRSVVLYKRLMDFFVMLNDFWDKISYVDNEVVYEGHTEDSWSMIPSVTPIFPTVEMGISGLPDGVSLYILKLSLTLLFPPFEKSF